MRHVIDRYGLTRDDTPERLQAWLRANGVPDAEVVSTAYNPRNGNLRVTVMSETNPTEAMMAYVSTPTPREAMKAQIVADAKVLVRQIAQKGPANWTAQDKVILGFAIVLQDYVKAAADEAE